MGRPRIWLCGLVAAAALAGGCRGTYESLQRSPHNAQAADYRGQPAVPFDAEPTYRQYEQARRDRLPEPTPIELWDPASD